MFKSGGSWVFETPEGASISAGGSASSGWVEGFSYAYERGHVFIVDGGPLNSGGQSGAIDISSSIVLPNMSGMRIEMRGTVFCFQEGVEGPGLTFKGLFDCDLQMGSVTYKGADAAVLVKPPIGSGGVVASALAFRNMGVYGGPGARAHLEFDFTAANATIVDSKIEVANFASGLGAPQSLTRHNLRVMGPAGDGSVFRHNHMELGACMHASVSAIELGQAPTQWIEGNSLHAKHIAPAGQHAIGVDDWGQRTTALINDITDGEGGLETGVRIRPGATGADYNVGYKSYGPNAERPWPLQTKLIDQGQGTRFHSR